MFALKQEQQDCNCRNKHLQRKIFNKFMPTKEIPLSSYIDVAVCACVLALSLSLIHTYKTTQMILSTDKEDLCVCRGDCLSSIAECLPLVAHQ